MKPHFKCPPKIDVLKSLKLIEEEKLTTTKQLIITYHISMDPITIPGVCEKTAKIKLL